MLNIKKWIFSILLVANSVVGFAMTPDEAKAFFKEAYKHTVLNLQSTKQDYANYFSKDFVMKMNGKVYHFDEYVKLMFGFKEGVKSIDIDFKDMVSESDRVATSHVTHVVKENGEELYFTALSLFKIQDHKFINANELTKLKS